MKILFLLLGIFSTLGALMINIGSQFALFNIILFCIIIFQLIKKRKIIIYSNKFEFLCLFIIFLVSSLSSLYFLPTDWSSSSLIVAIKYALLLMPIILLFSNDELNSLRKYFFNGLLISSWIQLLWELLQLVFFNGFGISINQVIFGDILHIKISGPWTVIMDGQFRPTGVSWDASNLTLALIMGLILSNNLLYKICFLIGILLSTSRTGIVLLAVYILYQVFIFMRNTRFRRMNASKKNTGLFILVFGLLLLGFYIFQSFIYTQSDLINSVTYSFQRFFTTFDTSSYTQSGSSALVHQNYYNNIFSLMNKSSLYQIFFGYGTCVAGYPFTYFFREYTDIGPWTPESDFITLLFGNGIIGLLLYYKTIYTLLKWNKRDIKNVSIILMIFVGGITYVYIRGTWTLLILVLLYCKVPGIDEKKERFKYANWN